MKNILLALVAVCLTSACASTTAQFNPIEQRTMAEAVRLKLHSHLGETGSDATNSAGINLDIFRAKVMNSTSIRFVEGNEDASIYISFGPAVEKDTLGLNKHVEQRYTMRITESSGRVIYIVSGQLVGQNANVLASELNRVFVESVIPVLEGKPAPAAQS